MKQYELKGNELVLKVKRGPVAVLAILYFLAVIFFLSPFMALVFSVSAGKGFHMGLFILFFVMGICGFYLLRVALWNTFGKEMIAFHPIEVTYIADYGWFKDGKKTFSGNQLMFYSIGAGYEEDGKGILVIEIDDQKKQCATKMRLEELEELIHELSKNIL